MSGGRTIDLNADVGEGFGPWTLGDDATLMRHITSANVACGFHAGDPSIMRGACELAVASGVRIGAHVGYRDLAGFGRRALDVPAATLCDEIAYQLGALEAMASAAGGKVAYVKPHGALYHRCAADPAAAQALVEATRAFRPSLAIVGAPGGEALAAAASAGLPAVAEGFADRGYAPDGRLLPRAHPGALLDAGAAAEQARRIATGDGVATAGGADFPLDVRTVCVHGDQPGAAELARAVREALEAAAVRVSPFT